MLQHERERQTLTYLSDLSDLASQKLSVLPEENIQSLMDEQGTIEVEVLPSLTYASTMCH